MSNNSSSSSGGIGFTGLLTIVFITLKLTGVITWPWIWVLSPLWMVISLIIAVSLVIGLTLTAEGARKKKKRSIR